jgi:Zn-dependent protease/CBS domain-containing protein
MQTSLHEGHAPVEGAPGERDTRAERPSWSWEVGTLFGVAIRIHVTFVVLLAWIALSHVALGHGGRVAMFDLALMVSVFAVIVLHELSHALTARSFGIRTRSITLLPIGGVASLERMPDKPTQELLVAVAGPLVNVAIAALIFLGLSAAGVPPTADELAAPGAFFAAKLFYINLSLAAFNLLPAFPLDGGRVLRAALALRVDRVRATEIAARIGRGMAVLLGIVGLLVNPMLVLIAVFVWLGAGAEAGAEKMRSLLADLPVRSATASDMRPVSPEDDLASVARVAIERAQHDFPVIDHGELVGVLTRDDLLRGLTESGRSTSVDHAMHKTFAVVQANARLSEVLPRLDTGGDTPTVVVDGGGVVGLLLPENVADLVLQEGARASHHA